MADARSHKFDLILTKSLSRFARNTVVALSLIRELTALGITIDFEKESINTLDFKGEVLLTIIATLAQQESQSPYAIAKALEADGILTGAGKTKWYDTTIRKILQNEKYMGDALLQKTYTINFLTQNSFFLKMLIETPTDKKFIMIVRVSKPSVNIEIGRPAKGSEAWNKSFSFGPSQEKPAKIMK